MDWRKKKLGKVACKIILRSILYVNISISGDGWILCPRPWVWQRSHSVVSCKFDSVGGFGTQTAGSGRYLYFNTCIASPSISFGLIQCDSRPGEICAAFGKLDWKRRDINFNSSEISWHRMGGKTLSGRRAPMDGPPDKHICSQMVQTWRRYDILRRSRPFGRLAFLPVSTNAMFYEKLEYQQWRPVWRKCER